MFFNDEDIEKTSPPGWKFLTNLDDQSEANIVQALLESEGIKVFRKYQSVDSFRTIAFGKAIGGANLFVPEKQWQEAQTLLVNFRTDNGQ